MPVEDGIVGSIVVNLRLPRTCRGREIDDRFQDAVIDDKFLSTVFCFRIGVGNDDGDRIADVEGLPMRKRGERADLHRRPVFRMDGPAGNVSADLVGDRVRAGQNRDDPLRLQGGGGVDLVDRCMRVRRAHEIGVGLARTIEVVNVVALAGNEADVFLAFDGGANAGRAHDLSPWEWLKRMDYSAALGVAAAPISRAPWATDLTML